MTAWRLSYNLPPNDPRFLEITEDQIVYDLLVRRFYDDWVYQLLHPNAAAVEDLASDPVRGAERLERVRMATMSDPAVLRALRKLGLGGRTDDKPPPRRGLKLSLRTTLEPSKRTAP